MTKKQQELKEIDLSQLPIAIIDLETTGLHPQNDAICEIGAVKLKNSIIYAQFSSLVNPQKPMPSEAQAVHNISEEMLKSAPKLIEVLPLFLEFIDGHAIAGHNIGFDLSFLLPRARSLGRELTTLPIIDTLKLSRKIFSEKFGRFSLENLAQKLKIQTEQQHRALNDARTTAKLLIILFEELKNQNIKNLKQLFKKYPDLDISEQIKNKSELEETLWFAIEHTIPLKISYRNNKGNLTKREVLPQKFIPPYLYAHCYLRNSERAFRIDRIEYCDLVKKSSPKDKE